MAWLRPLAPRVAEVDGVSNSANKPAFSVPARHGAEPVEEVRRGRRHGLRLLCLGLRHHVARRQRLLRGLSGLLELQQLGEQSPLRVALLLLHSAIEELIE
jgi:hypothetical protein